MVSIGFSQEARFSAAISHNRIRLGQIAHLSSMRCVSNKGELHCKLQKVQETPAAAHT
jgi:hypothetical protein